MTGSPKNGSPKRIHIIGSGGSGKTTLARQLAAVLQAPCYELDHIAYDDHAKRSLEERKSSVRQIVMQPSWVSEGGYLWWTDDLFQNADMIVWLDLHWTLCYRRIVLRHVRADIARTNAYPGFLNLLRFAGGVRQYCLNPVPAVPDDPNDDATKNRAAVAQVLGAYSGKTIRCTRPTDVSALLKRFAS